MPNAAASLDTDYGTGAASRRRPTRAASRKKGRKRPGAAAGSLFNRMPRYGAIAITALIGIGIVVNALMMQHGHHPAPLFDTASKPASGKPSAETAAASRTLAEPKATPVAAVEPPPPQVATRVEPAARAPARASKATRGDDAIARLLNAPQTQHRGKTAAEKRHRSED